MTAPNIERFAGRPFSFYPPILRFEHNEWTFQRATWSEILVRNTRTRTDLWVPRRFLGEISQVDEPVMIVGLNQELEYRAGTLIPHHRRVVEMPAGGGRMRTGETGQEAAPQAHRGPSESPAEKRLGVFIAGALLVAILGTFLVVALFRARETGGRLNYRAVLQTEMGLTAEDNYFAVIRKLGEPASDRWRSETGERQYRALHYPDLRLTVILMGADREETFYIGAKDEDWKTVHSVKLPGGGNTDSILRGLERF